MQESLLAWITAFAVLCYGIGHHKTLKPVDHNVTIVEKSYAKDRN